MLLKVILSQLSVIQRGIRRREGEPTVIPYEAGKLFFVKL